MDCSSCGTANPPQAKFCFECAAPLTPPQNAAPRNLADTSPGARSALEDERKQVTVLFADVVGSTELIQDLDAEDAQRLLDGATTVMSEAVHRFEGTISRLLGDGLMAMFGAPVAHEDHALRACYAALAMHDAIRRYADEARQTYGVEIEIRVGLSSGEVIVRLITNNLHSDYTAMGQTVHLASRMEGLARASTTRLTAQTLALVEGYVQVRSLGRIPVRGVTEAPEVFELLGAGRVRTRLQAATARGLTRFVGRLAEMDALHDALERARDGHGQIAALVGEPGVGKSRLVWELTHSHRTQDLLTLESGSVSYGRATSYLPVIDLLKSYCRIEAADDARTIREKVTGKLLTLDEGLRPTLPALLALLDVPTGDDAWAALAPAERRRQTLDAVQRVLHRESEEQPLLLVFEDLHWIDSETQALLDSLVERLPTARILLLVNFRPEYRYGWGENAYATLLRIDPLGVESADELLVGLLGADATLAPLKALLTERTEGNPLFLEESVRSLVEGGLLVGARGAYRMTGPLSSVRMPATVQAVLAARIDRLPPDEKRLLQTAAVIGKDVPEALLRAVDDRDAAARQHGLAELQAAEFLYEASLYPEREYTFKHALTLEVAYGSLLRERRRGLHRRIVDAMERLYADRLVEHVERLAHHAVQADEWQRAATYNRQAGARAMSRSAHREAVAFLERALLDVEHLPRTPENIRLTIQLTFELRNALFPLSATERIFEILQRIEGLVTELGDESTEGWFSSFLGNALWARGDHSQALVVGRRALVIADRLGDLPLYVVSATRLGQAHARRGEHREAVALMTPAVAAMTSEVLQEIMGPRGMSFPHTGMHLGRSLRELGEFDEAATRLHDTARLTETIGRTFDHLNVAWQLGAIAVDRGQPEEAVAILEPALDLCRAAASPVMFPGLAGNLVRAYVMVGRTEDGMRLLEEIDPPAYGDSLVSALLAAACLTAGDLDRAEFFAQLCLTTCREHGERGNAAVALSLLGQIALRRPDTDPESTENLFRQALVTAEELGTRPLQAHCHLGLGKLYRQLGRAEAARDELTTAASMLRELGMAFWLPEAEAALA